MGLLKLPGIEDRYTKSREVLHVAGDDRKIVLNGCCCDHAVRDAKRSSCRLPPGVYDAPTLGDGLRNGKNALPEQERNVDLDVVLQLQAAGGAWHQKRRTSSQFSD